MVRLTLSPDQLLPWSPVLSCYLWTSLHCVPHIFSIVSWGSHFSSFPLIPLIDVKCWQLYYMAFPGGSEVKNLPADAGDIGDTSLIPGWERSPEIGYGSPVQHSCLEHFLPSTEEPVVLQSMGSQRVWHDWAYSQNASFLFYCVSTLGKSCVHILLVGQLKNCIQ